MPSTLKQNVTWGTELNMNIMVQAVDKHKLMLTSNIIIRSMTLRTVRYSKHFTLLSLSIFNEVSFIQKPCMHASIIFTIDVEHWYMGFYTSCVKILPLVQESSFPTWMFLFFKVWTIYNRTREEISKCDYVGKINKTLN